MSRLKEQYQNEIVDAMIKKFGYKNIMEVPKLDKVVINMGVGEAKQRSTSTAKSRRSNMSSARRTTPISAVSAAEQTWIFPILSFVTAQNAQATTASVRTI